MPKGTERETENVRKKRKIKLDAMGRKEERREKRKRIGRER